jgi:hypothetical protein
VVPLLPNSRETEEMKDKNRNWFVKEIPDLPHSVVIDKPDVCDPEY